MASLATSDKDVVILKAGWIYRQKPLFKKWKKTWMVVSLGGNLKYFKNRKSSTPIKQFDVKKDCMMIKTGRQCHYLLPPRDIDSVCLLELFFTGDKTLRLCARDIDSAKLWIQAILRSQSERELPTPRYERKNYTKEDRLKDESEKENKARCFPFCCCGPKNKIQEMKTPRAGW